jgi:protein-L-isoaspartate(D-aspartate) O-methyltransferase
MRMRSNTELVDELVRRGTLTTPTIVAAFRAVDRKHFVQSGINSLAYEDHPLDIGYKATISQPTTVAFMLEKIAPKAGEKILDIGSGSGWTTTLLACVVGATGIVRGVEIVPELVEFGSNNLKKYPFSNAEIVQARKKLGLESKAPFEKILVSASIAQLPEEIITQLTVGGTLVIPIGEAIWQVCKISATQHSIDKYPGFVFVPLQR